MRLRLVVAGFALLPLLSACTPPPPPDTSAADIAAVKAVEAEWVKAAATKDADKFVAHYTEDAAVLLPNAPLITGRAAARDAFKPLLADPNFALTFQSTQAHAAKSGDMVYTVGTYSLTVTDAKEKKPVTDKGKYITVFRKQADGSWKASADMINTDMAMPQ
jgi:uncharacterized protein (TIGR02246 family)